MKDSHVYSDGATSLSLLARACADEAGAWDLLVDLYAPLLFYWCHGDGLRPQDAEDVVQDVFTSVAANLQSFDHNSRKAAFRTWLRTITRRKVADLHRRNGPGQIGRGGSTALNVLGEIPDGKGNNGSAEHATEDQLREELAVLYHRAWELIRRRFSDRDCEIFRRVVENGERSKDVAEDLGITANTASIVVCRIKKELLDTFGDAIEA